MRTTRKPRSDSYAAQLSPAEREQLHGWLREPGLSLEQVRQRAKPWRSGPGKGKQPGYGTIWELSRRGHIERVLARMEATAELTAAKVAKIRAQYKGRDVPEALLDDLMLVRTQEALQETAEELAPQDRTDATRLALQHSQQRLREKKFQLELSKAKEKEKAERKKEKERKSKKGRGKDGGVSKEMFDRVAKELKLL